MANLTLLTEIAANEAWEALDAVEDAARHWRESLADGVLSPGEATDGLQKLEDAIREAREAKVAAEFTHSRNRAAETLMRSDGLDGLFDFSAYRRELLKDAGVMPLPVLDNMRQFVRNNETPAAG